MSYELDYLLEFTELREYPLLGLSLYAGKNDSVPEVHYHVQTVDAPFWAFVWPGGQALARWTLDHPEVVRGKRVLDIGPGAGVNSIAAALAGASQVVAADIEEHSVNLTRLNVGLHGLGERVKARCGYVPAGEIAHDDYDVILMGDCFYDAQASFELNGLADVAVEAGIPFYTGDPIREHFPLRRATELAYYVVPDTKRLELSRGETIAYVFELGRT